jgi:hypothetical protein
LLPSIGKAKPNHDPQVWTAALGTVRYQNPAHGPAFWLDTHMRRSDGGTMHIVRPGVGWRFNKWLSLWAGYAWVPFRSDADGLRHEHRPWQQAILKTKLTSGLSLQSRTRFEQRFLSTGDDMGYRVREFVRASRDLTAKIGIVAWDELFVALNDTDWGASKGLDQNRLFAGFLLHTPGRTRLEMGYLMVYLNRSPTDTVAHVLATNFFWTLGH